MESPKKVIATELTIAQGPVGAGADADVEWVDVASRARLRDAVLEIARAWCG